MKNKQLNYFAAGAALLASLCAPAHADVSARLIPLEHYQVNTTGIVRFGTVLTASTNLNALWASANFKLECSDPHVRPPITGKRGWSDNGIRGPRFITITVPEWVGAEQELPGWQAVMGGTYVSCVNTQWGYARTNILPIGSGGTSFPIGGESWEASTATTFGVIKPGTEFGGGCIL